MNITIIGAGPIGCYAGYLLAQYGHDVSIYDKKQKIGLPVQCTGLLTTDFKQFGLPLHPFLVNTIRTVEVNSPNNRVEVAQEEYVISREKFDQYLADLAIKAGAKIFLNHVFVQKEENGSITVKDVVNNHVFNFNHNIIIAADGPLSPTAKAFGLYSPERENCYGIQAVVEGIFDQEKYQTFFDNETLGFSWIVPESSTRARIGVVSKKNTGVRFRQFIKKYKVKEIQAGVIPLFYPRQKLVKDNCYVVGDASSYVKATTFGGLVPGMQQAHILADCLHYGKSYEHEMIYLKKKLKLHLKLRQIFDRFSDQDYDRLISWINQPKIKTILLKHTRDNPVPLVAKALLKEPRLLWFGKYLF